VRFDSEDAERPLRSWDLLDGDLVERDLARPDAHFCDALRLYWCIVEDSRLGWMVRLARDAQGAELVPTPEEAALARVAELEEELGRRR
jgi:hypothetical protein